MKYKEIIEIIDFAKKLRLNWLVYWSKDEQKIKVYEQMNIGLCLIAESNRLQKKPEWLHDTIERCCTAYRDEKKTSLPRHTQRTSRNKHIGDTNSATAYKPKSSKKVSHIGAKEKKRKTKQLSRKRGQNV